MSQRNDREAFRIEWGLHEFGPRPPQASRPAPTAYRDVSAGLDFSRLDLGRALAAGYVPANAARIDKDRAA